jgi:GTP cyclohydrolase II
MVRELVREGTLNEEQAALARLVPMAEDLTAEADSGGHTDNRPAVALLPTLLGVHSSCVTAEAFAACDCDCAEQLSAALARIARVGRGVVFYLQQEGRGAGFAAKVRDRMLVQASGNVLTTFEAYDRLGLPHDQRTYEAVAAMTRGLDLEAPLHLLTGNPDKAAAVTRGGARVAGHEALAVAASAHGAHLLAAKRAAGHITGHWHGTATDMPAPIAAGTAPVSAAAGLAYVGAYWLPIRTPNPAWFWLDAYQDARSDICVVVLTAPIETHRPQVAERRDRVFDRFPLREPAEAWPPVAAQLVRQGGFALFRPESPALHAAADAVLRAHLRGRTPAGAT